MSRNSLEGILSNWDQLLAAVEANQDDLPHVEALRAQFEASLADLKALHQRRTTQRAEMLRGTRDLKALIAYGRELAVRIRDGVRSQYGFRNDKVIEFGIRPNRRGKPARDRPGPGSQEKGAPRNPTAP